VRAPVDEAEPTLADEAVDAELTVEHLPDEAKRVRWGHATTILQSRTALARLAHGPP
jgi:hypothetical protein